jgi:predicted ester cyclase
MSDENKAIVQRFFDELWNSGNPDAIDEVMDAGCDGDICYPRPGGSLPSAEEVFPAAHSALYSDSVLTRLEEMTKTHPELSRSIVKNLIIHHEGNFRGIVKSAAKKFRTAIPDVKCTIEEMVTQDDTVWTRWTLVGTFQTHDSGAGASLRGKPVTVIGVSLCTFADGKIRDYRSWAIFPDHWLQAVSGTIPRP